MRVIKSSDYLKICDVKRATFDARTSRNEIAYAFGLARRLAGGVMLDLDCVCQLSRRSACADLHAQCHAAIDDPRV